VLCFRNSIIAIILLSCSAVFADTTLPVMQGLEDRTGKIDRLLERAISRGLIAGGVVLIGNRHRVLFERPYGRASTEPDARPMTLDTIFDLASLTKVIATTPAILKLAEERRLSLVDPIVKWFPEFAGKGKDDLLVMNLLTHTSGLDDFTLSAEAPRQSAVNGAAAQKSRGEIGSRFKYADINFILLSDLVTRVTGFGLDCYTAAKIFAPMGMEDTGFNPAMEKAGRCSATLGDANSFFLGVVQDATARRLGGVAGHAGLFSTAHDLAKFCRMFLGEGEFEGTRILSERAVQQMTAPYFSRGGQVVRGLGWDIASPYSSPKGNGFSEMSFGHTGYSGASIWIDPATDTFVVLLTARLEYRKTREFSQLRSELSSLAAELFSTPSSADN
jgi:CubicO group peptidase (beta-lactamase class C family)